MPLFSCKFEATIGGDSGQQRAQPNNLATNENRQQDNEPRQPINENRQPDNPVNPDPPNNENRQVNNPEPENPDHQNNGNPQPQPNNPENPDHQNRGNRQPRHPGKTDSDNNGNRHPNTPENLDPGNNEFPLYNNLGNPAFPNFGTGNPRLFSVANEAVPKSLFVQRADSLPRFGVPLDGRLSYPLKRSGETMTLNSSKLQKMDSHAKPLEHYFSNPVPENGLKKGRSFIKPPAVSIRAQEPRNNARFSNSNRDISLIPTLEAINEQVRCSGDYEVWNLSVRHRHHGEVMFLGSRDLSNFDKDLSKLVVFSHGNFTLGPKIQHDPVMCTLYNITRDDLAKQVNKTGGPPTNNELYRILTALAIVVNAKCWAYSEKEKEWTFLTSAAPPTSKGSKQGGQSKQNNEASSDEDYDDDQNDDDDYDDSDY